MFSNFNNPTAAYKSVGVDAAITTADPHKLVLLLLDGALSAIAIAKGAMHDKDIPTKGSAISKAIDIINNGLRVSLDKEQGGELAVQLDALYEYMAMRLLHANMKNDAPALDEVTALLGEIHSAWTQIRKEAIKPVAPDASSAAA